MRKLYLFNMMVLSIILLSSNMATAADPPYIQPIPDQTATMNELFTLDIDAIDADPAETYELLVARPGMTIDPVSGIINWTPTQPSDGGVVTVRAYNTAGESTRSFVIYISDAIVCSEDLISYWKLDETTGTEYADYQGGYTATALTPLTNEAGRVGNAQVFSPVGWTDQYVFVNDEGQYDFPRSGGFSVSLWFKYQGQHTQTPNNQVLIARGSPSSSNPEMLFILMVNVSTPTNPRITFSLRPRSTEVIKEVTPNITLMNNQWYHVVAVYDGAPNPETTYMRVYINNQKSSYAHGFGDAAFIGDNQFDLNIGFWDKYPSNRYPFNGSIDEVLIYNRELSDSEVSSIYNDGLQGIPHCKPGNYYPLITSTPNEIATQDVPYSYVFAASDYEGEPITLSGEIIPDWLTFDPITGELSGTPGSADVGENQVKLMATDGSIDIFQEFTIMVDDVNDPPTFDSEPDTVANEGVAYTYFVAVSDPENNALTLTAEVLPSWISFNAATKVLVGVPTREDAGINPVKLVLTDGEFTVNQEFNIRVASNNNLPVFTSIPVIQVDNYGQYIYQVSAFDADATDVLTFSAETIPSWLDFDPESKLLAGMPQKQHVGQHNVVIVVADGFDEVRQEFVITVRDVNAPPQVLTEPGDTAKVSMLYTYLLVAQDPEGSPVTANGLVIPDWLTFDPSSMVLSGTPSSENLGAHNVIITLSDGLYSINYQFAITVAPRWGVGIGDREYQIAKVYPNPADDYVVFEILGSKPVSIELSDISGKQVIRKNVERGAREVRIDVSVLKNGIYMYRIIDEDEISQEGKVIIK